MKCIIHPGVKHQPVNDYTTVCLAPVCAVPRVVTLGEPHAGKPLYTTQNTVYKSDYVYFFTFQII